MGRQRGGSPRIPSPGCGRRRRGRRAPRMAARFRRGPAGVGHLRPTSWQPPPRPWRAGSAVAPGLPGPRTWLPTLCLAGPGPACSSPEVNMKENIVILPKSLYCPSTSDWATIFSHFCFLFSGCLCQNCVSGMLCTKKNALKNIAPSLIVKFSHICCGEWYLKSH